MHQTFSLAPSALASNLHQFREPCAQKHPLTSVCFWQVLERLLALRLSWKPGGDDDQNFRRATINVLNLLARAFDSRDSSKTSLLLKAPTLIVASELPISTVFKKCILGKFVALLHLTPTFPIRNLKTRILAKALLDIERMQPSSYRWALTECTYAAQDRWKSRKIWINLLRPDSWQKLSRLV